MQIRPFDPQRDTKAILRMWLGIGWMEKGQEDSTARFLKAGSGLVADVDGEAECYVSTAPGEIMYLSQHLPLSAVTAVTTSRRVRKQGFARQVLAQAIEADVLEGAYVCALGMFEQGFYDQLGFGTGAYEHWVSFDPSLLKVDNPSRFPRRIAKEDWETVHAGRLVRMRVHGSCNILQPELTRVEMMTSKNGFGFGFCDDSGELTHHLWCASHGSAEYGPYSVYWMAYRDWSGFVELLEVIRSLGEQIRLFRMREPPGIQLQDLMEAPFWRRGISDKAKYETRIDASAYWQLRICDLSGCLEQTHLPGKEVAFNLALDDPIAGYLPEDADWRGEGGDYVVTLGPSSGAEAASDPALPTLQASVGAFTRMWLGVLSASSLSVTDELAGPADLLEALDDALWCLPTPMWDWDF